MTDSDSVADRRYGLGSIAVWPVRLQQVIGGRLITSGFDTLVAIDSKDHTLIGKPNLYGRFGFLSDRRFTCRGRPNCYVQ